MPSEPSIGDSKDHIQTDAVRSNLKRKSLQSGLISFAVQPLKLALGVGSTSLLARLLTPADFGLVAMVAPLLTLVDSLSNFGLETATIQRDKLSDEQLSASFWLSLKINIVVIGVMMLMAPVLAWFYGEEKLTGITLAMAVGALSVCLAFQHKSLLKRQMRFGVLTLIDVGSILTAAGCAIAAALLNWGYWALVLQLVVMQLTQSIAYWLICDWRPKRYLKNAKLDANLKAMLSYGANLTGFRFITRIGMQLDRILVGYVSGAGALGLYHVAYKWAYFSFEQVYHPLFDVAVSSFSRAYQDPELYRAYCRRGLMSLFALCFPALAFLFVEARDVLLLLLGNQWLEAVPLFRLLTIAVFFGSIYRVTKWLYVSSGQTKRQLRWGLIHTPTMIVAVAIGSQYGAYGVALGYTTGLCLLSVPSVIFCLHNSPLSLLDFFSSVWRSAFASVITAVVLFAIKFNKFKFDFEFTFFEFTNTDIDNIFVQLITHSIIFGLIYLLLWIVLPGGKRAIAEVLENLRAIRSKGKK
ncbi:MAG: lipopolysaccharide biosynthesis protein [Cyanobacteria bacterium J06629_18]